METEQIESMGSTQLIQTNWEELSISNDFMFGKVIQNPELQKSIKPDVDAKSVRLDVYVKDNKDIVYDIEMQVSDTKELPKRSRF